MRAATCACSEVLRVIWTALMKSINMTGKNQQQVRGAGLAEGRVDGKRSEGEWAKGRRTEKEGSGAQGTG